MRAHLLYFTAALAVLLVSANASFNVTYLNTTVILGTNSTAHVVETLTLYVSNSSAATYQTDREAFNFSIASWQQALQTSLLTPHILNPKSSDSNFTLLPGPLVKTPFDNFTAAITFSYYAHNVTTSQNIAPRKFQYTFNSSVFDFEHTASGQALPANSRLNLIIPQGAQVVTVSPLPDNPPPNLVSNYKNVTQFSWYQQEPLSQFAFTYDTTESLQTEVLSYFQGVVTNDLPVVVLAIIILVSLAAIYVYIKFR